VSAERVATLDRRRAGVLLHLSSLDAGDGRGALGMRARSFIDWLAESGFSVWQILPVGPTGTNGSPYWVSSDYAGAEFLIDSAERPAASGSDYDEFRARSVHWLDDYALFAALRAAHGGAAWQDWPAPLRERESAALAAARVVHAVAIEQCCAAQFAFDVQWRHLRAYAAGRGVRLFGDLPIYVAPDSAETWAHREQFRLDATGHPLVVAGVPPDYFAADGQLWGNPLYDWDAQRCGMFAHWRGRVAAQLQRFDLLRLDHFRGLAAHWAVPRGAATARDGAWVITPGEPLLDALARDCGAGIGAPGNAMPAALPFVAEDLGVITPDVDALRHRFALPGMHVVQFGFDGAGDNPHLPHMHRHHSVVYTGTHDNDTTVGWLQSLDGETLRRVEYYCGARGGELPAAMTRATLGSVAQLAVLPMQDLLGLDARARFNTPGTVSGNWSWRLPDGALTVAISRQFALLNRMYGRA
jgi:4-alpha-glucanotransferase